MTDSNIRADLTDSNIRADLTDSLINGDINSDKENLSETIIMDNNTLSYSEKYVALLRLKMFTEMKEAVISVGQNDLLNTYQDYLNSQRPIFVEFEETAFVTPKKLNILEDNLHINNSELLEIWLDNDFSDDNTQIEEVENKLNITDSNIELRNFSYSDFPDPKAVSSQINISEAELIPIDGCGEINKFKNASNISFVSSFGDVNVDNAYRNNERNASCYDNHQVEIKVIDLIRQDYSRTNISTTNSNNQSSFTARTHLSDTEGSAVFHVPDEIKLCSENCDYSDKRGIVEINAHLSKYSAKENATENLFKSFRQDEIKVNIDEENLNNNYFNSDENYQNYSRSYYPINFKDFHNTARVKLNNSDNTGTLKRLPLPLVTLILGVHMIM